MKVDGTKFKCGSVERFVGPNEIPFFVFSFWPAETISKDTPADKKAFLDLDPAIKVAMRNEKYYAVGTIYSFSVADSIDAAREPAPAVEKPTSGKGGK